MGRRHPAIGHRAHRVRTRPGTSQRDAGYLRTTLGQPVVLIELREPRRALGPYGTTREVRQIGVSPDDLSGFRRAVGFGT